MEPHSRAALRAPRIAALLAFCVTAVLLLLAPAPSVAAATEDSARAAQARTKQQAASALTRRLLHTSRRVCARRSPAACRGARARVKRARRQLRATKAASMRSRQAAPVVTVSDQTLIWSRVADVSRYVLATKVPGRPTAYQTVSGLSIAPPAVPGSTVAYSVRTDVRDSRWSADVSISYAASGATTSPSPTPTPTPTPTPSPTPTPTPTPSATPTPTPTPGTAAPVLTVDGETIRWAQVADVTSYVLATKVPGQPVAYRTVTGLSVTPPAVPGQTVTYGLRTNVAGSEWAAEVQIAYAATAARPEWLGGVATWYGFNGTTEPERWQRLRAKLARFDAAASGGKAVTDEQLRTRFKLALDRGVRPYPVLYWDSGAAASTGYTPRMPTDADLDRFVAWMKEHQATVPEWELGNEVGFDYMKTADTMADDYARTAMAVARKMAAAGVTAKLVLNADLTGNGQFIAQMAAAEPTLGDRPEIGGFSIHPYGPRGPSGYNDAVCVEGMTNGCGWEPYIDQTIARIEATGWNVTVGQGAGQKPLHVTEWGFATTETWPGSGVGVDHMWNGDRISDGGFARPLNFGTKGDLLYANIKAMYDRYGPAGSSRAGAISRFVIYKDVNNWPIGQRDAAGHAQREAFFGVLQHDGSTLPGVTEKAQQALDLR